MVFMEAVKGQLETPHLPQSVWNVLQRENITTFDQLEAVAERIDQFLGIEPKNGTRGQRRDRPCSSPQCAPREGPTYYNPWQAA